MTAEELATSPVIRMAGSDGHAYETTADRANEMADAARQEGVTLKPFIKTKDAEGNVHEISPFDGEGLKAAEDRGDDRHVEGAEEPDYFSAEALKAGATRFAIGLVNPLDWIKGIGTAAGTVAKGFVKGTVGTVLSAARGATYLGESITNAFTGDDDHTVSDAIGGVNSGMNKWLDILFEDVHASTGEYGEDAKKATGAIRNLVELVANVKGISSITKGLAASEVAAAKAAGVVNTANAAKAGMKVAHTATGALFGLGKYGEVASDPNGPGGARQQAAALVAGAADAVLFGLWNPLKISQKYAQEMSPFMEATRKEIMKRVMVKVGQAAESGATMALVEAVKQGAEQVASIGTEKVEGVDEEGNPVKNWAARTLEESAMEVGTQFLVGSAFVALDVAEQEMGRFGYNRARKLQGEIPEGLSDKMKVAMSYQVERNRRAYAPERDRQARFALQARLKKQSGDDFLEKTAGAYGESPDVKAVNDDGSVTFKDGSVWRLDPRMEGGATITVGDGTILSERGELLGYRARQESGRSGMPGAGESSFAKATEDKSSFAKATEDKRESADVSARPASNALTLLQQIDEGALPIKEVELAAVEPIAPTENGGIIEVWDPQKYKPIVVLEDLEGNLKALTGGKRILAAKGEGLEKLRAVVVREADGWTAEEASKLSATENLRQGLGTMKNVVEAVDSLGEEDVLALAGWHQANGSREFASTLRRGLKFARNATPELKAALEDGRISDEFAANAAGVLSMERIGENWQAAQKAVADLIGNVGQEELEAVLWGVQKKLVGKAATPEEIAAAVQECREEFNRKHGGAEGTLDSDTTLVETGKNELKTIGEVESSFAEGYGGQAGNGKRGETEPLYAAAEAAKGNKAVELKPIAGSDGTFTTLAFPDAKIKIDGEQKVIAVDGLTVDDFAGMKVTDAAALVASVEAKAAELGLDIGFYDDGVRAVWEGVKARIKAEGAAAHERQQLAEKSGTVVDMLQKSFPDAKLHKTAEEWAAAQKKYGYELKDAEGEIYGFTDPATGDIYLNPDYFGTKQALEAPIHEYGHLGIIATKKVNKAVYDRGMKLANDFLDKPETAGDGAVRKIVDFILSDPVYSKQAREVQCEELLAQLIGKRGEEALRAETNKTVVAKVKSWLVEFWNTFGKALGLKEITPEQAEKMTVEQVADAIRAEMFSGRKYGEGLKGVEFADGGARAVTKPVRVKRKLTGRRKAVNEFVKLMGGAEDPANTETDMLALWVDNGGRLFDKMPFEVETGYSKGASGVKATRRAVADEFAESTAFYQGLDPAQRKVFFGSEKLETGSIGEGLREKLDEAGITRFTRADGTVDYEAAIDEFKRQWTNYERGKEFLKERGEYEEEAARQYVEEMERAERAEREAYDEMSAEEARARAEMEAAGEAQDAQIAEDIAAGRFSRRGPLFSMSPEERAATPPWATEDVPQERQLLFARAPSQSGQEYTYSALTARPDMPVEQIDPEKFKNYKTDKQRIEDAKDSVLAAGGKRIGGDVAIEMDGSEVVVRASGIKHRGGKPNRENDMLFPVLGPVLKNAIPVNELAPRPKEQGVKKNGKPGRDHNVKNTFVFLGAFGYGHEICPVRIQVVQKGRERSLESIDVLKSLNTKIGETWSPDESDLTSQGRLRVSPKISIANLIGIAQPLHPKIFSKDVAANLNVPYQGNEINARYSRAPEAKYVKLTRVADDAGAGEQTPGALAASRELSRQGATPLTTRGTRYVSLPLSEMNALARWLTGHAMPAEMSTGRKLGVPGKASTKHRKLVIAADVVGSIDKTDAAKETATLKQHGFFRNEDPNWVANHSPVEVRQERVRSEEALSTRLEALADRRAKGTEPGGMAAGRKVFADQLAKVVMSMPHGQPGVLGAMQTVGGALERRVQGNDAEADAFLDWMEGAAQSVQRSPQDRKAGMFGAFLMMPKEMEQRARGWYDAIRSTIAGDQKLADAFRMMTVRSMTEQGYSHLEKEILRAQSAQTEQALKKLREESNAPIAAGGLKDRAAETVVLSCHDRMGAALVRVDASVKLYLAAQKKLMASAPDAATKAAIKQQTDLFMGQLAQAKNQAELSRTAWERGHNNADARYLYRMVDLLNEATVRDGLKTEDVSLYLDQQRVIETQGLSGSRGESARQAQIILDAMKRRLGPEKWAKIEAFARKFSAIHEQELLNDPVLERILGKGTVDYWRGNTHYVTTKRQFSPEELAEIDRKRFGDGVGRAEVSPRPDKKGIRVAVRKFIKGLMPRRDGTVIKYKESDTDTRRLADEATKAYNTYASKEYKLPTGGVLYFAPDARTVAAYSGDVEAAWGEYALHLVTHRRGQGDAQYRSFDGSSVDKVLPNIEKIIAANQVKTSDGRIVFYMQTVKGDSKSKSRYACLVTEPDGEGNLRVDLRYVTGMQERGFLPGETATLEEAIRNRTAEGHALHPDHVDSIANRGVGGKGDDVVVEMFRFCERAGMDTGAAKATARLKGSFSDKQEVMSATFEKVAAIKRWLRRCEYVIELRDLLKLAKVEGVHDFAAGETKFPDNNRYGHISYMENGRRRVLVVPKEIADGFKAQRVFDTPALKLCASVNNIARQLWIDWNPVYWQRNIGRNVGSIEMNMPGMKESAVKRGLRFVFPGLAPTTEIALTHLVRHMPEKMSLPLRKIWGEHTALFYAPKAKRMAMWLTDHNEMQKQLWAAQDRGDLGTVQEMLQDQRDMLDALRGNMLVGMARGEAGGTTAFLDDSVRTVGKTMARELQEMQAKPKWRRALEAANIFAKNARQQVFEDVMAKFAAYLHDRAQFGTGNNRSVAESGLAVKKNVSIGEGERKGKDTRAVQAIFQPFWNMVEKGVVRNVKAYGERPGETFQKAAWRIAPMILHGLVGSGAIAAWILKSNDGDEDKVLNGPMADVYRYARDAQRAYQNCSNYVRENYHVTPLMTDGYTSIVLGMPLTDEERLLKPIARFVTDAASVAAGTKESLDVAKALHDATLGVVAPDFKLAGALPTLFDDTIHALLDNPNDYYTGGQKYDNDLWLNRNENWEMRGKFAAAMAKRLWNDFGGRNVLPVDRAGVDNGLGRAPGWVAKMVNDIPLASPILRSFVKVQVGSPKRDAAEITEVDNRRRAACRVHAKELFEIARKEKRDLSLDRERYTGMLKKWQQSSEGLSDEDLAYIEQHYLNAWRAYEGAQYRADGEREKFRAKAEKLGLEAAHLWLDFD